MNKNHEMQNSSIDESSSRNEIREFVLAVILLALLFVTMI